MIESLSLSLSPIQEKEENKKIKKYKQARKLGSYSPTYKAPDL